MNKSHAYQKMTSGPIASTLISLSAPMLLGILSMMSFNLIDTYFVSRLGTLQLAALTLTFPVSMVVATITLGIGVGAMAIISRSIGEGKEFQIKRYATDALTLSTLIVVVITLVGFATVEPLFKFLGAASEEMPYVKQYMYVWYPGMVLYVLPMIGSNILRATGDTVTPSVVMIAGMAINTVLDWVFIFGWGPVPRMEIAGAAVASVVSRGLMLVVSLWILHAKKHMLASPWPGRVALFTSWKAILKVGLAVAASNAVIPVAMGIITKVVTRFGPETVAGYGVATRIEGMALTVIFALSTGISPFVGQNYGAKRIDRVEKGIAFASQFSLIWSAVLVIVFFILGKYLVQLFTTDSRVISVAVLYLYIIPISLGLRGVHQMIWTSLNVLGRPKDSLVLELILAFGLWIPFSFFGAQIAAMAGVFIGLSIANIAGGIIAYVWVKRVIKNEVEINLECKSGRTWPVLKPAKEDIHL